MAKFESKYKELTFFHNGQPHSFYSGTFETEDVELIATIGKLTDVQRVDEPKEEKAAKPKSKPKASAE